MLFAKYSAFAQAAKCTHLGTVELMNFFYANLERVVTHPINDVTCTDKRKTVISWKMKGGLEERHYTRLAGRALNSIKTIEHFLSQ